MSSGALFYDVEAFDVFEEIQSGIILPQGTSAPLISSETVNGWPAPVKTLLNGGGNWSVTRLGVGQFVVKLLHGFGLLKGLRVTLGLATPEQLAVSVGPVTVGADGNPTFEIDVIDPATFALTDIAAASGQTINWVCRTASAVSQSQTN